MVDDNNVMVTDITNTHIVIEKTYNKENKKKQFKRLKNTT